jgi:hypothetical protein
MKSLHQRTGEMSRLVDFSISFLKQLIGAVFVMGVLYLVYKKPTFKILEKLGFNVNKPIDKRKERNAFVLGGIVFIVIGMLEHYLFQI